MNARDSTTQSVQVPSAICWRMDLTMHFTRYAVPCSSRIFGAGIVSVLRSIFMAGASCGLCDDSHFAGRVPAILHQKGIEAIKSGANTSIVPASLRIRYLVGVTAAMRAHHGATVYQIKAVLPHGKEHIDLVCEVINVAS